MIRGIYTAATGMLVQELKADTITNNLANINTPGYKRDQVAVSSFPEVLLQRIDAVQGSQKGAKPIGYFTHGSMIDEQVVDWSAGILEETGNPLDLAINGEGFFTLDTAEGLAVTKNGAFQLNSEGYLVNSHGQLVLGMNGPIFLGTSDFQVAADGTITIQGEYVDRLLITQVDNPQGLRKGGHDLYYVTDQAQAQMLDPESVKVQQGYLEKPNINVVNEIIDLLATRRVYEASQKVIQAQDEVLAKGASEIGSLR